MICLGIRTSIAKKPYIFVIFSGGGGVRTPCPPPSGSANDMTCINFNPFLASYDNCRLPTYLLIHIGNLYCKQYGPRSDCSLRSSLIRVHSVRFYNQKYSEVHLDILICTADVKCRQHFQDKNIGRIRVRSVDFLTIVTLENHCTRTAQSSRGGCSRRAHKKE